MVKIGERGGGDHIFKGGGGGGGGPFISAGKGGNKCFKGGPIFSENIGPAGPFFWSGGTVFGGTNCYVTILLASKDI